MTHVSPEMRQTVLAVAGRMAPAFYAIGIGFAAAQGRLNLRITLFFLPVALAGGLLMGWVAFLHRSGSRGPNRS